MEWRKPGNSVLFRSFPSSHQSNTCSYQCSQSVFLQNKAGNWRVLQTVLKAVRWIIARETRVFTCTIYGSEFLTCIICKAFFYFLSLSGLIYCVIVYPLEKGSLFFLIYYFPLSATKFRFICRMTNIVLHTFTTRIMLQSNPDNHGLLYREGRLSTYQEKVSWIWTPADNNSCLSWHVPASIWTSSVNDLRKCAPYFPTLRPTCSIDFFIYRKLQPLLILSTSAAFQYWCRSCNLVCECTC